MNRLATAVVVFLTGVPAALAQGVTLPDHHSVELDNGIVFLVHEKKDVPLVGLHAIVAGGAVSAPRGKAGLASLAAGMLEKGAGDRDAAGFAEAVGAVGGRLSASASAEGITISADFLARDTDLLLQLLADMLRAPKLDFREFAKLRDRRIDEIRAAKDGGPHSLLDTYGAAWLFGDHPYGAPVGGSEASLRNISHRDLLAFYDDHVGADRTIIALVGDIDAVATINKLTAAFDGWRAADAALPEIEPPAPQEGRRVLLVDKPGATQVYFWFGNVGVARDYPRRAELNIANTLFGGSFGSLLLDEMRMKSGLTYAVWSAMAPLSQPGFAAVGSFTQTDKGIEAIDLALQLLGRLHAEAFTADKIQLGKNLILGQFPFQFETAAQLAKQLAELEAYGLGPGYINDYGAAIAAANAESIGAVIAEVYPQPENLVFVIIGDAGIIREGVTKYGPVTEIAISDPFFRPPGD